MDEVTVVLLPTVRVVVRVPPITVTVRADRVTVVAGQDPAGLVTVMVRAALVTVNVLSYPPRATVLVTAGLVTFWPYPLRVIVLASCLVAYEVTMQVECFVTVET